jgi:predicted ATP-binding protein involved in virulence
MIKKIKWRNYKSLGNLELDFTDSNGKPYNTIILAGENGSGKTTVLDTLFEFLNLGTFSPFEYIDYNVVNTDFKLTQG